jgi:hypothetical protein
MRSVDENNGLPKETQMAQCTVQSGDIKASAQATFSKKLEGFCSTREPNFINFLYLFKSFSFFRGHDCIERKFDKHGNPLV